MGLVHFGDLKDRQVRETDGLAKMRAMAATAAHFDVPTDSSTLEAWLKSLPADCCAAFVALRDQAKRFATSSVAPGQRFSMLERMRSHAVQLMPELRTRYLAKPVPLEGAERQAWETCVGLWEAFYFAYALCTESGSEPERAATVWHRALDCLGCAIRECGFGYHTAPSGLWKELNSCYRTIEGCSLEEITVREAEQGSTEVDCKRAYLAIVLHDAASIYSLSTQHMLALEQLLPAWAAIGDLTTESPTDPAHSPLAIDLAGDAGALLARTLQPAETVRHLDTSILALKLRELAAAVRSGTLPLELAAVRTMPRPALERLLTHLYIQWCSGGTGRTEERRESTRRAQIALNMHAIHFQISGRAFRQPGLRYTREEEHDLATFGHITERTEQRLLTGQSSALEPWEIANQSASGVLSMLRKPDLESRIQHGQLIAMRTSSIEAPSLATVQRIRIENDGCLSIGIRTIRADVRGAAVRPQDDLLSKFERALIVEADQERSAPGYLILPPGRFSPGATIELHSGRSEKIKITSMLEQNVDHDRATYTSE